MTGSEIAGNIIQILAGLPEFLRKPMLKSRMNEFFTLPDAERKEMVTNALSAAPNIDFGVLGQLVKTWMEVLSEVDEEKRRIVFSVYADVIADSPGVLSQLNTDGLIQVFSSLPTEKGELLATSLRSLVGNLPEEKRAIFTCAIPQDAKKILQLS